MRHIGQFWREVVHKQVPALQMAGRTETLITPDSGRQTSVAAAGVKVGTIRSCPGGCQHSRMRAGRTLIRLPWAVVAR